MDFVWRRLCSAGRIAWCLFLDALIFCYWLLITWGVYILSSFFKNQGVPTLAADTFAVVAAVGTLTLAVIYIVHDIIFAVRDIVGEWESRDEEEYEDEEAT